MVAAKKNPTHIALGPLADQLGFHLAQASVISTAAYNTCVGDPLQLRKVEYSLLVLLFANSALSPKQLSKALSLTAPNLTLLLDRLQERDLIVRERNPNDGRSQHVRLSDAGQALVHRANEAALTMREHWQGRLTTAENAMLMELLSKVYDT